MTQSYVVREAVTDLHVTAYIAKANKHEGAKLENKFWTVVIGEKLVRGNPGSWVRNDD